MINLNTRGCGVYDCNQGETILYFSDITYAHLFNSRNIDRSKLLTRGETMAVKIHSKV
jgi:hypothetical protein